MKYYFSESGLSTASTWLQIVLDFIEAKKLFSPGLDITLITDNLGVHQNADVAKIALDDGVRLVFLPPNTSHIFQPLDQEVFAIYKTVLDKQAQNISQSSALAGDSLSGTEIMSAASALALEAAMTQENIKAAFQSSFIWPWNPTGLLEAARLNIGEPTRRVIKKIEDSEEVIRRNARQATASYLRRNYSSNEDLKKRFVRVCPSIGYEKNISAELLIHNEGIRRKEKEMKIAAAASKREAAEAKKRAREPVTCRVPGCTLYEGASRDLKRNPFRWCDYCDEYGICGRHYAEQANQALLSEHELVCAHRPGRPRKVPRKD